MEAPEVFEKAISYLVGEINLGQFEDWLTPHLEEYSDLPRDNTSPLVDVILGGLAEMSLGHRTEDEFKTMLGDQIGFENTLVFQHNPIPLQTGTSSSTPIPITELVGAGVQ